MLYSLELTNTCMSSADDGACRALAFNCLDIGPKEEWSIFCIRDLFMLRCIEIHASKPNFLGAFGSTVEGRRGSPLSERHTHCRLRKPLC